MLLILRRKSPAKTFTLGVQADPFHGYPDRSENSNGGSMFDFTGSRKRQQAGPITGMVFVLIGAGCLYGAWFFGIKTKDLLEHGLHTTGQVVDVKQELHTDTKHRQGYGDIKTQHMMYYPIVKFDDSQHHSVQFTQQGGSSSPSHNKGDSVEVIYLEIDPQGTAIINEGMMNWIVPGALGGMGLVFALAGAWAILKPRTI